MALARQCAEDMATDGGNESRPTQSAGRAPNWHSKSRTERKHSQICDETERAPELTGPRDNGDRYLTRPSRICRNQRIWSHTVNQLLPHCRISFRTFSAQFHDCEGLVGDTDSFQNLQYAIENVFSFLHYSELSTVTPTTHHHSSVPSTIP